jgi:hypothetical protein
MTTLEVNDNEFVAHMLNMAPTAEEIEKERKEKARRIEFMDKFITALRQRRATMEFEDFDWLARKHYIGYSYKQGGHLVLFPAMIQAWTLYDDYVPLTYEDPPEDEKIVCHGANRYGLKCSISNKRIKRMSHDCTPRLTKQPILLTMEFSE